MGERQGFEWVGVGVASLGPGSRRRGRGYRESCRAEGEGPPLWLRSWMTGWPERQELQGV